MSKATTILNTQLTGHVDITPPACGVFARQGDEERCPAVLLLHADATPAQLLGFAHGRVRELCMLASLASASNEGEGELREVAEHLWLGLEGVLATLNAMHKRMGC